MPDDAPPRRRVRLVPVASPRGRPDAVPVARQVLARAHAKIGPEGVADVESRLAAQQEVEDEIERAGDREDGKQYPVRLCTFDCSFRVGDGPGCTLYQKFRRQGVELDGEQCERDVTILKEMEEVFRDGKENAVRELAGRVSGAVVLQIHSLLNRIIADGAMREIPIFDAKGAPVTQEEIVTDAEGEIVYLPPNKDGQREPKIVKRVMTRPIEHPLFPRLLAFLKETRLIDFAQYELTPKSSATPAQTDGMILAGDDEPQTLDTIRAEVAGQIAQMDEWLVIAARRRSEDPTYIEMRDKYSAANEGTTTPKPDAVIDVKTGAENGDGRDGRQRDS